MPSIFDDFDARFDKPKKPKSNKIIFTTTETEKFRDMQWAETRIEMATIDQETQETITTTTYKGNGGIICYNDSYKDVLRGIKGVDTIFLDLETGSYNPKLDSLDPWHNCWPIGIAICGCFDTPDGPQEGPAYYIPIDKNNENMVYDLLFELFNDSRLKRWVNHNIKYDAHVLYNCAGINPPANVQLVDTLTLAKLVDSERFRYGLDALSKDWLDEDISIYEHAFKPYLHRNKDYSAIPVDIIGPYACQDVLTNRKLYNYICKWLPKECYYVRDIEIELTRILIQIERNGLRINPQNLLLTEINNLKKLISIEEQLEKITGRSFRPHTNADCFDILCNFYGLPVLKWTNNKENEEGDESFEDVTEDIIDHITEDEEGLAKGKKNNPSFDKHSLVAYLSHPLVLADERIKQTVELIAEYRKINTFNNLFVKKYKELLTKIDDTTALLHPFYNQCVRSGRMSCKRPNAQQLNKSAKSLILPYVDKYGEEEIFVSYDFSQIEYRTIAHYIENPTLLDEYNNNPDADFHEFVAKLVKQETGLDGMTRQPAKTLNFGLGFNMGKKKLLKSLQGNMELMSSLVKELNGVENFKEAFEYESEKRAEAVYNAYHKTFPEMKQTSKKAESVCKQRGYIRNLFNRRRHLEPRFSYKAFNTINQASAADIMKDAMVRIGKILQECNNIIRIVADVHDEILFSMPRKLAEDPRILHTIAWLLENPVFPEEKKLLVPIRVAMGIGETWKDASGSAKVQNYDKFVSVDEFKQILLSQ